MSEVLVRPTWRERLEELGGRKHQIRIVALLIVAAAAVGLLLWNRAPQPRIAPPARSPANAFPGRGGPSPGVASPTPASMILVHVAGAVHRPGLYELPLGARVADAIDLARGPRPGADLDGVNLAEILVDGQKLEVPKKSEVRAAAPGAAVPSPGASSASSTVISLNSADQTTLESIPGVGPVTAAAILAYRDEMGGFSSVDELIEVSGIGPATLESIRPYVTL
ncbi:MAG: helix-hairpin-helix domain-containing protein [Actinomycetota bacterium]|nr:helix-hairpin-helix domain-containing protein [Actinomycetota bacterium]